MSYNTYAMEIMVSEIYKDRIREAREHNRWAAARKAMRELSKNLKSR